MHLFLSLRGKPEGKTTGKVAKPEGEKSGGLPNRFLKGIVSIVWVAFAQNTLFDGGELEAVPTISLTFIPPLIWLA